MNAKWEFTDSFFTTIARRMAWSFWSDMQNHAEMEKVTIELDGPFQAGTKGRTIFADYRQEWVLTEVIPAKRFVITGRDSGFELSFAWDFEDEGSGTRMTQTITANGPETELEKWSDFLDQMEVNAPKRMKQLAELCDKLSQSDEAH